MLPVERLRDLEEEIRLFQNNEDLNGFQKFIVNKIYQFEGLSMDFEARSTIVVASPTPAYAMVRFKWKGKEFRTKSLARSYVGKPNPTIATKQYLDKLLNPLGYHVQRAPQLPLKRLAVRSGLAAYGRNNVCYVNGTGSFFTLVAYLSDMPCGEDCWSEIRQMDKCARCTACLRNCPTGAIREDRFLIDNERCLSYFNEVPRPLPDWLPISVHHCLYDCLMCQNICPENQPYMSNVIGPIEFDEDETNLLLSGEPIDAFPDKLKGKVQFLGMDEWLGAIPRNMRVLFEAISQ